jgi:hypothetical protein
MVMAKIGLLRSLVLGSAMVMLSNTGFSLLAARSGKSLLGLGLVNGFDNLALAMHGTALIAFLSSLTSVRYTATPVRAVLLHVRPARQADGGVLRLHRRCHRLSQVLPVHGEPEHPRPGACSGSSPAWGW